MTTAPSAGDTQRSAAVAAIVGMLGLALLLIYIERTPVAGLTSINLSSFSAPSASKFLAMFRSLSWLGLINLSVLCLGALFEHWVPLSPALSRFRILYRLGIGFSLLGFGVLLLASFHQLHTAGFAVLLLAAPIVWSVLSRRRFHTWREALRNVRLSRVAACSCTAYALLLANAFLHVFGHDVGWDALTYHLAFPERYLFENGIVMTPFSHLSGYIAGTEMLYTLALFLDGPALAVLIHFEFGALTLAALWGLAGAHSRRAALLAPLFLISDPLFQLELGWAYSDLSLVFYVTLASIAYCTFTEARSTGKANQQDLIYAGVALGLCVATRYLGASVVVALCVLTWLPPLHVRARENLMACSILAGLAAVVMLPWMVRNAVLTGNPITPLLQSLFHAPGEEYIPAIVMQQSTEFLRQIGMGRDFSALLALPWNLTMNSQAGTYGNSFGFVISPLYLVGLVAVAGLAASGRRLRGIPLLVPALQVAGLYVVIWFLAFQEARFLIPIFPLLAFAGAVALDRLIANTPRWGRGILVLPLIAVLHAQFAMLPSLATAYEFALGRIPPGLHSQPSIEAAAEFLRDEMESDDKLLLWMEQRAFLFHGIDYLPYHIGSGSPTLELVHRFTDHEALHCELQTLGITYILVNRRSAKLVAPGLFVAEYGQDEFLGDRGRINRLVRTGARLRFSQDEFEIYQLDEQSCSSH